MMQTKTKSKTRTRAGSTRLGDVVAVWMFGAGVAGAWIVAACTVTGCVGPPPPDPAPYTFTPYTDSPVDASVEEAIADTGADARVGEGSGTTSPPDEPGVRFVHDLPGLRPAKPVLPGSATARPLPEDAGVTAPSGPPVAGECPVSVTQCAPGWACRDGLCQACQDATECLPGDGCQPDGWCGACQSDSECPPQESCLSGLCQPAIGEWELVMEPDAFSAMVVGLDKTAWFDCALRVGDAWYTNGRARLRGGSSLPAPKRSFRIEFPKGEPHPGLTRKINLRAEWNDPSYLRGELAANTFRHLTRVPTYRTRYVNLHVNGELYGLMHEVERVGSAFVESRGLPEDTPVYDADPRNSWAREGIAQLIPLPSQDLYELAYDKQNGVGGHHDLMQFVEEVIWPDFTESESEDSTSTQRLRQSADLERIVDYLAAMAVVMGHDHVRKNFVLARLPAESVAAERSEGKPWSPAALAADAPDTRWAFVPWDLDLTFGCLYDQVQNDTICDALVWDEWYDAGHYSDDMKSTYPTPNYFNMLIHLVVNDPELRPVLVARVCEMVQSNWWNVRLPDAIESWREHLRPWVEPDTKDRNPDLESFDAAVDEVAAFVSLRRDFLVQQLGCEP